MEIDAFLDKFVRGYLLGDLESMARVQPLPSGFGACGYSMVATTIAGIELLGGLTSPRPFTGMGRDSRPAFRWFWETYLYPDPPRRELVDAIYPLVRNGIAHTFTTKPGILIHKERHPGHLQTWRDDFIVDALTLFDDFGKAFVAVETGMATGDLRSVMQLRLNEMIDVYSKDSDDAGPIILKAGELSNYKSAGYPPFMPSGQYSNSVAPSGAPDISSPTISHRVWPSKKDEEG